jgi:recombination protein RecA
MAKEKNLSLQEIIDKYKTVSTSQYDYTPIFPDVLNILWGGGVCPGHFYSVWGEAGCGKSSIALQISNSYCQTGKKVWYIDSEYALNERQLSSFQLLEYVESGHFTSFSISDYKQLEDIIKGVSACDKTEELPQLIVLDSESMLLPYYTDRTASVADHQPGVKAKQAGIVLPLMKSVCANKGISVILILHARANLDMNGGGYGPTEKSAGSYVLYHVADVRTKISVSSKIYETPNDKDSRVIGCMARITTEKNKFASPRIELTFPLIYGQGITNLHYTIYGCIEEGIISGGGGGVYTLPNGEKVKGSVNLYNLPEEILRDLFNKLHTLYIEKYLTI